MPHADAKVVLTGSLKPTAGRRAKCRTKSGLKRRPGPPEFIEQYCVQAQRVIVIDTVIRYDQVDNWRACWIIPREPHVVGEAQTARKHVDGVAQCF